MEKLSGAQKNISQAWIAAEDSGILCEGHKEITHHGGWRNYLAASKTRT